MNTGVFLSVFFVYILLLIVLSGYISKRQKNSEGFLLGGRGVPFILMLGTTIATMVGTGSSMGAIGKGYSDGWAGALYGLGGSIGIILLGIIFANVRKFQFMTFSEEISYYYGANTKIKNLVAWLILLAELGWLGAHILGGGLYLSWITRMDLMTAKCIVAMAFSIYVIIGGYLAVVWTDTIQAIILFTGFIILAFIALDNAGGLHNLHEQSQVAFTFLEGNNLIPSISLSLVILVGVLATPGYRQRIYSGKDVGAIKKSFFWSGGLYLGFCFLPAIIGMSAYKMHPGLENPNYAFPYLITEVLPPVLGMIVLIAGLSATMSSASSDAIAAASIMMRDLYKAVSGKMPPAGKILLYSRIGLFAINAAALIFSLFATDIIGYIQVMISLIMSGLFVCSVFGRFWSRVTWQGGIASLAGGVLGSVIILLVPSWKAYWGNPIIPAVVLATFFCLIVSWFTPPNSISPDDALEILSSERKEIE